MFASILALLSGCYRETKSSCIAHLKQIEGAKAVWALEEKKTGSDIPTESELFGVTSYIREKLVCPAGGVYTIGRVDDRPGCSVPAHDQYWANAVEWGKVYVVCESCVPLVGVMVQVVDATGPCTLVNTDINGLARVDVRGAKEIVVSKTGYGTNTFILPQAWPFRLVLLEQTQ